MSNQELLSNEEMSALLPEQDANANAEREKRSRVVPYNFRRPDRLSKEQVRSLYLLHDLFANQLSSSLPLFLRTFSEVTLISVEQQSYAEYLKGLSDPTTIFPVSAQVLRGAFAIEIGSSAAFPIIDKMLGGEGRESGEKRAATEIELKILEGFLTVITDGYREAWKPIIEMRFDITGRETRPQLLQITALNEVVVAIGFQLQIGEINGSMSICLPVGLLEPIIEKFNQSSYSAGKTAAPEATAALLKNLSKARFPVAAELVKVRAAVSDLMDLAVGDVLRTNHSVEKPLEISIGGATKFTGKLSALEGRMIVQIQEAREKTLSKTTA